MFFHKNILKIFYISFLLGFGGNFYSSICFSADIEVAVQSYKKGYALFAQKSYAEANAQFMMALQALPKMKRYRKTRAALQRLKGLCHYHLKKYESAYRILNAYMTSPNHQKNKLVETQSVIEKIKFHLQTKTHKRIVITQRKVRQVDRPRPIPSPKTGKSHPLAFVVVGIGIATLSAAVITGVLAKKSMGQANSEYEKLKSITGHSAETVTTNARSALKKSHVANILYVSGGVLSAGGIALVFLWKQK